LTHRREGAPVFGFRKFLDDRDVGTVVIATPDLWHPLITVSASGKDVYVEKPVSNVVRESRLMVEAARRNKRIVQVGLLQRSSSHFRRVQVVPWGEIGERRSAQNCGGFPLIHEPNGPSTALLDSSTPLGFVSAPEATRVFWPTPQTGGGRLASSSRFCQRYVDLKYAR
jgi:predicted dehydrogenase